MASSQQQQVIVKAYYNDRAETQPEIRRFTIDISPESDVYRALETTITQLNSEYAQGQFTLQYNDEDNDRITFSSNGEFRAALNGVARGSTIKIFVKPKAKKVEHQSSENNATRHPGVTCDGCQGSVVGIRYKCAECPDYDLCQACSDKKVHPEHNMLKLTRPFQHPSGGFRRCGGGRGPFGGGRCGGGPRFWHHHMKQQQQQEGATDGFQVPPHLASFFSQHTGKELADLIEAHLPQWLRTEKVNELLTQLRTGEQADKPVDQANILEHVGKLLREFLSPFGIDCDYSVDGQKSAKPKETEEASSSTEPKSNPPPTATSSAPSASAGPPPFGNWLEQLSTIFNPMAPQQAANTVSSEEQAAKEQKKIDECVERLTSMGFVDSNGVLTDLIKSKKGDLNQVLDALNPRNYKN